MIKPGLTGIGNLYANTSCPRLSLHDSVLNSCNGIDSFFGDNSPLMTSTTAFSAGAVRVLKVLQSQKMKANARVMAGIHFACLCWPDAGR